MSSPLNQVVQAWNYILRSYGLGDSVSSAVNPEWVSSTFGEDWANARREDRSLTVPGNPPHEPVDHPAHYNASPARCAGCGRPIECIDVVQWMTFSQGNAVKYLWRLFEKGDPAENLRKAIKYCEFEIERLSKERD